MKAIYILPVVLIAIDIGAAVVYGINGDWKKSIYCITAKVIYWIAVAVLNAAVTF